MCRNIRRLYNMEPPVNDAEINDAALQFVRKVSGYRTPSRVNTKPFNDAVDEIAEVVLKLLDSLETSAPPHDRTADAAKARTRSSARPNPAAV